MGLNNPPPGITFIPLAGGEHHPSGGGAGAWADWDLTGIVPAGTKWVLLSCESPNGTGNITTGGRKNGSAMVRQVKTADGGNATFLVEPDSNLVIEVYDSTANIADFSILGYWI